MGVTLLDLDTQAEGRVFSFGSTTAGTEANVTFNRGTNATTTTILTCQASANIVGNLTVGGTLTIVGSIDHQSVTNLDVTDKSIRVNVGGTSAGATGSGLFVEGTSAVTIGSIQYDSTKASKFTIGDGTTQLEIVDVSSTQTLTNKSINASQINSGTLGITVGVGQGGTGATSLTGVIIGNGTSAFTTKTNPTGAFVGDTDTQTLTNKTLTSPKIGTSILDTNGNTLITLTATTSAVNGITITNSATGTAPSITASGTDTNIDLNLVSKGTGKVKANGIEVVDLSSTQTLTNKSISGNQINSGTLGITVGVAQGGTGLTTTTAYGVICGGTTSTGAFQNAGTGTTGQVLVSNGASALPTWQTNTPSVYFRRTTITGDQNGTNTVFTLGNALVSGTELITRNGSVQNIGAGNDYTISGTTLTFAVAPKANTTLIAYGMY